MFVSVYVMCMCLCTCVCMHISVWVPMCIIWTYTFRVQESPTFRGNMESP